MSLVGQVALALYLVLVLGLLLYGTNSLLMVAVHAWGRRRLARRPPELEGPLPVVTVQLAVFNEENVVARLLEAVGALDWPAELLEIQLLDDSTDATPSVAAPVIEALRARGLDVVHLRRRERQGYKAGALAAGLEVARGEYVALFDADFVPPPSFLRDAVPHLADPGIAAVQGRWTHLNRDWSHLTRAEALAIDGHFGVEQGARFAAGWFLNFNGSAGLWRRAAIDDAGGWSADTLTEDLDLSYRAQLRGWRLVFDPALECPAELPVQIGAFKAQQRRWATGSMQTARKLLPAIWRSSASWVAKLQASLHLTHYAVHPLIALTAVLSVPCVLLPGAGVGPRSPWVLLLPLALALTGPTLLHAYAQRTLEGRRLRVSEWAMLTLVGLGLAVSNTQAVIDAFVTRSREFVRTPKLGVIERGDRPENHYLLPPDPLVRLEIALALYCLLAGLALLAVGIYEAAPFLLLDAAAFATVARLGWRRVRA